MQRRILAVLIVLALVISTLVGCGSNPFEGLGDYIEDAFSGLKEDSDSTSDSSGFFGGQSGDKDDNDGAATDTGKKGNTELNFGTIADNGFSVKVPADTFGYESKVKVTTIADTRLAEFTDTSKYEIIGTPVEIESDGYNGGLFDKDIELTLPIPEGLSAEEISRLVVINFNNDGNHTYMVPDSYNLSDMTMTINLPHFSPFGSGYLTEKEQVNMFLDKYSAQVAVAKAGSEQAASELEPYINEKVKALGLSKETGRELVLSVITELSGGYGDDVKTATDVAAAAYKSLEDGDSSSFESKMEEIISGKLYDIINYNVFTGKADSEFKDAGKLGTIAGAIAGGDTETALKEIGDAIGNAVPGIGLTTKAIGYVGAKVNETFTNWKSNAIEDLYQKYKNGYEDMWGNEVISGDEESLKTYMYTASGFSKVKGVYRFYNMDKVAETCEKYGWGRKEYDELDEHYREIFDQRAEEGLLNYFKTRLAQEAEAEKIKESERECIEEMLSSYGCLSSGNYSKFFGEQSSEDYNLTDRLDRIVRVRQMLTQYVDEDALAKSQKNGIYNWGTLMNDWVGLAVNNKKDDAVEQFLVKLKDYGVINSNYDFGESADDLCGTYTGTVTFAAWRITEDMYQEYLRGEGLATDYGVVEIGEMSKADCDATLAEYADQVEIEQKIVIEKNNDNTCTVKACVVSEGQKFPMSAPAVLKGDKLILTTEEGNTEIKVSKTKKGKLKLTSDKAVLLMEYVEEGYTESFLCELKIDVKMK